MRRGLVSASVLAFLLAMTGGCGDTDKGVSKPPAPNKEERQKMQQESEKRMKDAGLDKHDADKAKGENKEDKK
jgi:hypothetical protein